MSGPAQDFVATIEPAGWRIEVPAGVSLLQAGLRAGVRLPSSCRNGSCRACLCRLLGGEVGYSIDWPGLSVDEKRDGFILPCVAHPLSDVVIAAPDAVAERDATAR